MLFFGRKISATLAEQRGMVSAIFSRDELLTRVYDIINTQLLVHANAHASVVVFKRLIKGRVRAVEEAVISEELIELTRRFKNGDPVTAVMSFQSRSKL